MAAAVVLHDARLGGTNGRETENHAGAAVWFAVTMFRSIMGRLDDSWTRPGGGAGSSGKRGQ